MRGLGPRKREHSNFQSRTALDEAGELSRQQTFEQEDGPSRPSASREQSNPYEPITNATTPPPREHELTKRLFHIHSQDGENEHRSRRRSTSGKRQGLLSGENSLTEPIHNGTENKKANASSMAKPGLGPRPVGGNEKLGMFSGV